MNDDYLWDRSGTPDPEVQHLEKVLGRFEHSRPAPDFLASVTRPLPPRIQGTRWWLAAAAIVLLASGIWLDRSLQHRTAWSVASLQGSPRIAGNIAKRNTVWKVGEWLETDATSRVVLQVGDLGQIEVAPNSRIMLLKATAAQQQIRLERGTISAVVTAPPYVFLVHTPSAYAMDMGCAYTLQVADEGSSILRVAVGWVDLQHGYRQSLVPAGAAAESRPGIGPGAPYFDDSTKRFRQALEIVNFDLQDPQARSDALTKVLDESRPRDAFTLLNLFRRVDSEDRGRLYDRLAVLLPPPPAVTRQKAVEGDDLSAWWNELGLGHPKKGLKGPPRVEE
ncbi:MAG: FecR domain-containing protein [Candidatus Acidiferrales bacterium]